MKKLLALCGIILLLVSCINGRVVGSSLSEKEKKEISDSITCTDDIIKSDITKQNIGKEFNANIGETFFKKETIDGVISTTTIIRKDRPNYYSAYFSGQADYFELVISSASKNKLILDYSEYFLNNKDKFAYKVASRKKIIIYRWLKRPAFDKSFEYNLNESKIVCFKNYKFKIINVSRGKVKYKRIE